ncbi:GAF domain-containing protein [Amnibacterium endophyticum]|uniref:GAF domain-containing protein n=1 Tax=Amnibacterium endophyticum TaxID=2109337 RepID=A0ABW4LFP4_9MICO
MEQVARFEIARLSGSDAASRRLLVIGDAAYVAPPERGGPAQGALPGALLRAPGAAHRRDLDVDVLWDLGASLSAIGGALSSWRLWRYDAVVIVVGGLPTGLRMLLLQRALARVVSDLGDEERLVVVLADPEGRAREHRVARARTARVADRLVAHGLDVPFVSARIGRSGGLLDAETTAEEVLGLLPDRPREPDPDDEQQREAVVDRSLEAVGGVTTDLQRVAVLARNSFDVPYAQVNLVSRGRLHSLAFAGRSSDAMRNTLSEFAVQQRGPTLVPDTQADRRFDGVPETRGPDAIRFYAAHPIESMSGFRIGVLCVFDTEPHPIEDGDEALLRDVAQLAEAELIPLLR